MVQLSNYKTRSVLLKVFRVIFRVILSITIVMVCFAILIYFLLNTDATIRSTAESEFINIPANSSFREISNILHENKIIENHTFFYGIGRFFVRYKPVRKGYYSFAENMTWLDLFWVLTEGKTAVYKFTLADGWNSYQVFEYLKDSPLKNDGNYDQYFTHPILLKKTDFNEAINLEGFLYPDTYYFLIDETELSILNIFINNFLDKLPSNFDAAAKKLKLTPYELLILASIIEKETAYEADRKLISSVFHNRLKLNMRFQTDPTVTYATKKFNKPITKSDLAIDSPYNTYRVKGFPPSPISSPNMRSIKAAMEPAKTNYLYFVSKGNPGGPSQFSTNLRDHNKAVSDYRKAIRR